MVTTVRLGLRRTDPCFLTSKTHLDVRAVACVHTKYQRRDSAAVSLKAQTQQYGSIQRNTDKVILASVIRSQHDGRQIGPHSRRRAGTRHQRTSVATRVPGCCRLMSCKIAISLPPGPAHTPMDMREWGYGGPRPHGPLSSRCLKADQRKGDKEAATSVKPVGIESTICNGSRIRREAP
jgi:hypothetical protein